MEMVYYSEDKKYAFFNGVKYGIADKGYYRATLKENAKQPNISRLHRAIWFYANGEIPEGCDVHHKDGEKTNNHIDNLIVIPHSKHSIEHLDCSIGKTWRSKQVKTYSCVNCGALFETTHDYGEGQNIYCSVSCGDKYRWAQKHPKEERVCPHCKKTFIPFKTDQIYCKDMCGQAERTKAYRRRKREALKNNKEN